MPRLVFIVLLLAYFIVFLVDADVYRPADWKAEKDCPKACYHPEYSRDLAKKVYSSKCCQLWAENKCRMNASIEVQRPTSTSATTDCVCTPPPLNCSLCRSGTTESTTAQAETDSTTAQLNNWKMAFLILLVLFVAYTVVEAKIEKVLLLSLIQKCQRTSRDSSECGRQGQNDSSTENADANALNDRSESSAGSKNDINQALLAKISEQPVDDDSFNRRDPRRRKPTSQGDTPLRFETSV